MGKNIEKDYQVGKAKGVSVFINTEQPKKQSDLFLQGDKVAAQLGMQNGVIPCHTQFEDGLWTLGRVKIKNGRSVRYQPTYYGNGEKINKVKR